MAGAFNGAGYTALVFQAVACDAAWKQFALLIDELQQEIRVFVVNIFDTELTEAAVLFATQPEFRVAEEFDIFS